jgi:hypothetical protein
MKNEEWTIQRNWQHWVHKTQDEDKKTHTTQYVLDTTIHKTQDDDNQHNMRWTPLCANKHKKRK